MADIPRRKLHAAIQSTNSFEGDEDLDGAVLTGWALVTEWAAPDGESYIGYLASDVSGEKPLPIWRESGLLYYALNHMGDHERISEDEED